MAIALPHREIELAEPDLSGDKGYPAWLTEGPRGHFFSGRMQYRHGWEMTCSQWEDTVREYERAPDDFHAAWRYLDGHPLYWKFRKPEADDRPPAHYTLLEKGRAFARMSVEVLVVRTHSGEVEVWLESGRWQLHESGNGPGHWHDIDLDTGAPTYEEAVCKLAWRVWDKYGNDRRMAGDPDEPPAPPATGG